MTCAHDNITWRKTIQKTSYGFRYVGKCDCGQWMAQEAVFSDDFNEIDGPND